MTVASFSDNEKDQLNRVLQAAIQEDCPLGDITTTHFLTDSQVGAVLIAKQKGVFFGQYVAEMVAACADPVLQIRFFKWDGDGVAVGDKILEFSGSLFQVLKWERVMLNLLQRLSGIATQTAAYVHALGNAAIDVMDTRKTTPGFRFLERKAVVAGGGVNHRLNLSDMVLLKENHLTQLARTTGLDHLEKALLTFKARYPHIGVEIEVESVQQLEHLPIQHADVVMFDNFSLEQVAQGVEVCLKKGYSARREVSGNVTLETIGQYRHLNIHRISTGSLTHSVKALDLSLLIQ